MKFTKLFTPQFKFLVLISMICSLCHTLFAQDKTPTQPRYIIEVDSQVIKATPYEITYENGRIVRHDENVEWYTDMTIYKFLPKEVEEKGMAMKSSSLKTTIFLLSGGGFTKWDNRYELDSTFLGLHDNLKLAKKLSNEGYYVIWVDYKLAIGSDKTQIDKMLNFVQLDTTCSQTYGTESKARLEYASLAAFSDFRKKFKAQIDTNAHIDPNNVFISGISAGAFLSIYSVFLDQNEIPDTLYYTNCGSSTIKKIDATGLKGHYPIYPIKGIIPLAGGSLYSNIFNKTDHSDSVAVNFIHGTCDEVINQNEGRLFYKLLLPYGYNGLAIQRYPYGYGSMHMYDLLKITHNKIGFGQVIKGGHSILQREQVSSNNGAWDAYNISGYANPPHIPNMTLPINQRDIVFDNISTFIKRVQGVSGYPVWENHAYSVFPDIMTSYCMDDDQTLINPPISTNDTICVNINNTATLVNAPSWATITWSVSPASHLQIVGANTGTTITYKGLTTGTGTLTAVVSYGGHSATVSKTVFINSGVPVPNPNTTPAGYNNLCLTGSKTLTLTNLPTSPYTINWTKTGGINIVSQSGASVTYQSNGTTAGGTLYAHITTNCDVKTFNYPITVTSPPNYTYFASEDYRTAYPDTEDELGLNLQCYLNSGSGINYTAHYDNYTSINWTKLGSYPTNTSALWSSNIGGDPRKVNVLLRVANAMLTLKADVTNQCGTISNTFTFVSNGINCSTMTELSAPFFEEVDYYDVYMSHQTLVITYKDDEENKSELMKIIISDKMGNIIMEKTDASIKDKSNTDRHVSLGVTTTM